MDFHSIDLAWQTESMQGLKSKINRKFTNLIS